MKVPASSLALSESMVLGTPYLKTQWWHTAKAISHAALALRGTTWVIFVKR